jgi:hypothetical protein
MCCEILEYIMNIVVSESIYHFGIHKSGYRLRKAHKSSKNVITNKG